MEDPNKRPIPRVIQVIALLTIVLAWVACPIQYGWAQDRELAQQLLTEAKHLYESGKISEAAARAELVTIIAPGRANARYLTGFLLQMTGQAESALENYERYVRMAPEGPYASHAKKEILRLKAFIAAKRELDKTGSERHAVRIKALRAEIRATEAEAARNLDGAFSALNYGLNSQ